MKNHRIALFVLAALAGLVYAKGDAPPPSLGQFEDHRDIGTGMPTGSALFNIAARTYEVTGGGKSGASLEDTLHYLFTRVSGDFTFNADVHFKGASANQHRTAALMIRQSLSADSPFADVALRGDGITALEYRPGTGVEAAEFRAPMRSPTHLKITRFGNEFTISANHSGEQPALSGPVVVSMRDPVYLGLAVSSHAPETVDTATFSNVQITRKPGH